MRITNLSRVLYALCLFAIAATAEAVAARWSLDDVSLLLGLPPGGPTGNDLPSPSDGTGLMPPAAYAVLPTLDQPGQGNASLYRGSLRAVALRVDPCPGRISTQCAPELRVVWQPLEYSVDAGLWRARDAAVHCLYTLEPARFDAMLQDLWRLKVQAAALGRGTDHRPLGVHPLAGDPETRPVLLAAVRELLRRYAGEDALRRVTYSALLVPTRWWRFGAVERAPDGAWRAVEIPRIGAQTVDIFNVAVADGVDLGPERGLDAIFNVLPDDYPAEDDISDVINKGFRYNDARDHAVFSSRLDAVARFMNPRRTHAESLDCAACHYANAARFYIGNRFPDLATQASGDDYANPDPSWFDLRNQTVVANSARVVRAFGIHGDAPAISQRTINESAAVAHRLNRPGQRYLYAAGERISRAP